MNLINALTAGTRKEAIALGAVRTEFHELFKYEAENIHPEEVKTLFLLVTELGSTFLTAPLLYTIERIVKQRPAEAIAEEHLDWADKWNFWRRMNIEPLDRLLNEQSSVSTLPWNQGGKSN
jgi:hypothetical protein